MKKTVQVKRFKRSDGSVVEEHRREIDVTEPDTLTAKIKRNKEEQIQASILFGSD